MRALITNDDGVDSAGIALLARVALDAGLDVVVVTAKDKLRRLLGAGLVEEGPSMNGSGTFEMP
ncbi:hypothetical protein JTZ10_23850, partial [Gordonia rubripertincta]